MLRHHRWRLILGLVACVLGGLAWQISIQMRQSRLNRALSQAVAKRDAAAAQRWLLKGANANAKPSDLTVFLRSAPRSMLFDPTKYHLLTGAARYGAYDGVPVAHCVRDVATAKALLAHGADPNAEGRGRTWLMVAAIRGDVALVRELLAHGGDVNRRATYGLTVLQHTVVDARGRPSWESRRYAKVARALLNAGADANAKGTGLNAGITALAMATRYRQTDIIRLLKQAGAKG
jgi:hypothetical protein